MVTFNGLVSWKVLTIHASIGTNVFFSTKANLYSHINFLPIKHADALESRSA